MLKLKEQSTEQHTVSSGMEVTFKGGVANSARRCATCFKLSMTWYNLFIHTLNGMNSYVPFFSSLSFPG